MAVNRPEDEHEHEADRVAQQVMRMPSPEHEQPCSCGGTCSECKQRASIRRKAGPASKQSDTGHLSRRAEEKVDAVKGGRPLSGEQRAFFEPRFAADFSGVRIHSDGAADTAAQAVGAHAYARGNDIVFRSGHYRPHTTEGRTLLAHELTHVLQQGAAPQVQRAPETESGAPQVLQLWPGDGMVPPGDCSWADYIPLRAAVETAKAIVSMLGACGPGDSCIFLASKIAAITAEIAARVVLDTTCFKGGDTGHRQQVIDKVNMMNRCYRFFNGSNCAPELIAQMAVVVEAARAVVAAATVVAAIAVVALLIVAVIALWEFIAAAATAVAEYLAIEEAIAGALALLNMLRGALQGT